VVYLAGAVSGVPGDGEVRLVPLGRSRITGHGGGGNGFHPAIVLTCARTFALSVIPGNRGRNSIAADNSPSWLKRGCVGIGLGDEEHPKSMVARSTAGKRGVGYEAA
jgi:hypothetical protein